MSITVRFRITNDRVNIEFPEKNIFANNPNVVFYDSQSKGILGIGESEETIRSAVLKVEKEFPPHVRFGKSFQYDDEESGYFDLMVIEYYIGSLYDSKRPYPYLPIPNIGIFNYEFQIDNYEKWSNERMIKFEYSILANQNAYTLKINNALKDIPIKRRRITLILEILLFAIIPLGALLLGLTMSNFATGLLGVITALLIPFAGFFISVFIGVIVWVMTAKILLPKSYVEFIISEVTTQSWEQKVAKWFLSIER